MMLLFFLQFDWNKLRPENLLGAQILERTPAGLTVIYLIGIAVLIAFLILSFIGNFRRPKFAFEQNLPKEVQAEINHNRHESKFARLAGDFYFTFIYSLRVSRLLGFLCQ